MAQVVSDRKSILWNNFGGGISEDKNAGLSGTYQGAYNITHRDNSRGVQLVANPDSTFEVTQEGSHITSADGVPLVFLTNKKVMRFASATWNTDITASLRTYNSFEATVGGTAYIYLMNASGYIGRVPKAEAIVGTWTNLNETYKSYTYNNSGIIPVCRANVKSVFFGEGKDLYSYDITGDQPNKIYTLPENYYITGITIIGDLLRVYGFVKNGSEYVEGFIRIFKRGDATTAGANNTTIDWIYSKNHIGLPIFSVINNGDYDIVTTGILSGIRKLFTCTGYDLEIMFNCEGDSVDFNTNYNNITKTDKYVVLPAVNNIFQYGALDKAGLVTFGKKYSFNKPTLGFEQGVSGSSITCINAIQNILYYTYTDSAAAKYYIGQTQLGSALSGTTTGEIQSLIYTGDNRWKQKQLLEVNLSFESSSAVTTIYARANGGSWVTIKTLSNPSVKYARITPKELIDAGLGLFNYIEFKVKMVSSSSYNPTFYELEAVYDDNLRPGIGN